MSARTRGMGDFSTERFVWRRTTPVAFRILIRSGIIPESLAAAFVAIEAVTRGVANVHADTIAVETRICRVRPYGHLADKASTGYASAAGGYNSLKNKPPQGRARAAPGKATDANGAAVGCLCS